MFAAHEISFAFPRWVEGSHLPLSGVMFRFNFIEVILQKNARPSGGVSRTSPLNF